MGQLFSTQRRQPKKLSVIYQERYQQLLAMSSTKTSTIVTRGTSGRFSMKDLEDVKKKIVDEVPTFAPEELITRYTRAVNVPPDVNCSICICSLKEQSGFCDDDQDGTEVHELVLCSHTFHLACVKQMVSNLSSFLECPICKTIHGVRIGNQPHGVMEVMETFETLPGFSGCSTIVITYFFQNGIQGPEHPEPGQPYRAFAFPRQAYLPNNDKGKKVLKLLQEAWRRRLVFTIGTSVTTGMKNVITWNEIHHKTSWENFNGHGYPDSTYLDNVIMELALQGVTDDSILEQQES